MFAYDTEFNAWGAALPPGRSICAPGYGDPAVLSKADEMTKGYPTAADAIELARMQYALLERAEPDLMAELGSFGGSLTVAEIDCDEIRVRLVRDALPTPGR